MRLTVTEIRWSANPFYLKSSSFPVLFPLALATKFREYPKIVDQLKSKTLKDDKIALAIYLLGTVNLQDANSIAALIEHIDFRFNVPYSDPKWRQMYPWSSYPARDALLRIGERTVSSHELLEGRLVIFPDPIKKSGLKLIGDRLMGQ